MEHTMTLDLLTFVESGNHVGTILVYHDSNTYSVYEKIGIDAWKWNSMGVCTTRSLISECLNAMTENRKVTVIDSSEYRNGWFILK